jgi:hypothetical protein
MQQGPTNFNNSGDLNDNSMKAGDLSFSSKSILNMT